MFKKILAIVALFLVSCTFNIASDTPGKIQNIQSKSEYSKFDVNTTYTSIVKILAKDAKGQEYLSGTGFAIDKDRIATAGHVCNGIISLQKSKKITKKIYMNFYASDGETILEASGLKILKVDTMSDSCVMEKIGHGIVPVKFVEDYSSIKLHSTVYIVGAPLGVFATSFEGKVVLKEIVVSGEKINQHFLIVDAASAPGNSGSPVFDENGYVIGMLVAGVPYFSHMSFCVQSFVLENFIANINTKSKIRP